MAQEQSSASTRMRERRQARRLKVKRLFWGGVFFLFLAVASGLAFYINYAVKSTQLTRTLKEIKIKERIVHHNEYYVKNDTVFIKYYEKTVNANAPTQTIIHRDTIWESDTVYSVHTDTLVIVDMETAVKTLSESVEKRDTADCPDRDTVYVAGESGSVETIYTILCPGTVTCPDTIILKTGGGESILDCPWCELYNLRDGWFKHKELRDSIYAYIDLLDITETSRDSLQQMIEDLNTPIDQPED